MSGLHTDERLAQMAARGDRHAFEEIYRRYHQDLYRFCLATAGRPHDAQDALQNTFVKVLRALPGESRRIQLKPWLYRIARNETVEVLRRRREGSELSEEEPAPGDGIAETAEARERLRRLIADLEQLPERQRSMLVMRELGGLGFEEIGDAFETSSSVARQTLYEARLSLRQMEAGREMSCDRVMRELSDADGRISRRREIRSHLHDCADCRGFRESIERRQGEFAALSPLPLAASAGLLQAILGGGAGGAGAAAAGAGGAGVATGTGAGAGLGIAGSAGGAAAGGATAGGAAAGGAIAGVGNVLAGSVVAKTVATVAVVAAVGVTAADRGGLIDVPIHRGDSPGTQRSSPASNPPGEFAPAGSGASGAGSAPPSQAAAGRKGGTPSSDRNGADGRGSVGPAPAASTRAHPPSHANPPSDSNSGLTKNNGHPANGTVPPSAVGDGQKGGAAQEPHGANPAPGAPAEGGEKTKPAPPPHPTPPSPAEKGKGKGKSEGATEAHPKPAKPEEPALGDETAVDDQAAAPTPELDQP